MFKKKNLDNPFQHHIDLMQSPWCSDWFALSLGHFFFLTPVALMFDPDRICVIDPYHCCVMSVCGCLDIETWLT